MQICNKCFKLYNIGVLAKCGDGYERLTDSDLYCIRKGCKGELFECDELIAPTIALLNKKGYKTLYCCSGHIKPHDVLIYNHVYTKYQKNLNIDSYIAFDSSVKLPNLPEGYKRDKIDSECKFITIRKEFDCKKHSNTLLYEIIDNAKILYEWAKKIKKIT